MNEKSNSQEIIDEVTLELNKKYDIKELEKNIDKVIEEDTKQFVKELK